MDKNVEILNEILACNTRCADLGSMSTVLSKEGIDKIDALLEVLPGIDYVKTQMLNYIFSTGLTTGNKTEDVDLEDFLYRTNLEGTTNYSVLRDAIGLAAEYGECGIRWYQNDIYIVKPGTYALLIENKAGINISVACIISKTGKYIGQNEFINDDYSQIDFEELDEYFDDRGYLFLDASNFLNIRNNTSERHGRSPFLNDKLRMQLLVNTYERLNRDLNYEGPGRIVLYPKSGFVSSDTNSVSTTEVMATAANVLEKREERAAQELEKLGKQVKESTSDSVIMLSDVFDKDIKQLPKVTKATEFFNWLKNEGVILSQALGMSPSLLELGSVSGNVSMEKIIDNSMLNNIVPLREFYAIQFSPFLSRKLGLSKIYFDKYELQQSEDENTMRTKIVNIMSLLHAMEQYELEEMFAEMLREDIHYPETGELRELSVQQYRDVIKL